MSKFTVYGILLVTFIATITNAGKVAFSDCGNDQIVSIEIDGCSGARCIMASGKTIVVKATFKASQDANIVKLKLMARVMGISFELSDFDENPCEGHSLKCPVVNGSINVFTYELEIPSGTPPLDGSIEARLMAGNGNVLACAIVDGEIE